MKLMSAHELEGYSEQELSALFYNVTRDLVCTKKGSPARRNALGTLENISRARGSCSCH
jgi:hypothetical protein